MFTCFNFCDIIIKINRKNFIVGKHKIQNAAVRLKIIIMVKWETATHNAIAPHYRLQFRWKDSRWLRNQRNWYGNL